MLINRIIYLLLLIASFVFSSFYGGYVPGVIRYFLLLVPLLSLIYVTLVYVRIRFHQEISSETAIKGETMQYSYKLKNSDLIPYLDIRLVFRDKQSRIDESEVQQRRSLMPYKTDSHHTTINCQYIGTYNVGIAGMEIYDFFHIFRIHYRCRKPLKLHVKPALIRANSLKPYIIMNENDSNYGRFTSSNEMLGCNVRNYVAGDSIRRIHWKNSAKKNELVTRQYESSVEERTAVILDTHLSQFEYDKRIETADLILQTGVILADYFCRNNLALNIYYDTRNGGETVQVNSEKGFRDLYDKCPDINMLVRGSLADTVGRVTAQLHATCSNIVIIGCCKNKSLQNTVKNCLKKSCQVTLINISEKGKSDSFKSSNNSLLHVIELGPEDDICEVLSE